MAAGSALSEGTYKDIANTDTEIKAIFEAACGSGLRRDTTYKFVFLKSIIDCLGVVDTDYKINFDQLFMRFTEIYWPLVVGYDLRQKAANKDNKISYVEQILLDAAMEYQTGSNSTFNDIPVAKRTEIVDAVKQKCKVNVVGALFGDTQECFYSFSKKDEWIQLNPKVYKYLMRNKDEIEALNYKAWADYYEKIQAVENIQRLGDLVGAGEKSGPEIYRILLGKTFERTLLSVSVLVPVIFTLFRVA